MHKFFKRAAAPFTGLFFLSLILCGTREARATADRQSFLGFGPGIEFYSQNGSGTGFYIQGFGGYNFNAHVGLGIDFGFSRVGGLGIDVWNFGAFGQYTDPESGLYGKFILDGVNAAVDGSASRNGVNGTAMGMAPGIGLGMLIPTAGSFHMAPEVDYRVAVLSSAVNLIDVTFNLVWDF